MANITDVRLLNVPLERDMKNTLYFASASAQEGYFSSQTVTGCHFTDFSYQRKDNFIRVPKQYDALTRCNYVMYKNTAYSNKWFYAFIIDMKYVDDNRTDVYIETDPIQTWMFQYEVEPSFIEREHVDDDTIGANTFPEQLELGEYVSINAEPVKSFNALSNTYIAIGVTKIPDILLEKMDGSHRTPAYLTSIPDGCVYIGVKETADVSKILSYYADEGANDAVVSVFLAPKSCFNGSWVYLTDANKQYHIEYTLICTNKFEDDCSIDIPDELAGDYEPVNNKLLTFPYRFLQASNNTGSIIEYKYEDFVNPLTHQLSDSASFILNGSMTPGCDIRVYPLNYKNIVNNYDEGITMGKYPIGAWQNDVYTNWLTQNGVNIGLQTAGDIGKIALGGALVASGRPDSGALGIASGVDGILNTISQVYQQSLHPPQAEGNVNVGSVNYVWGLTSLIFKHISIKPEYARIIDNFFSAYGYRINRIKVPNSNHRQRWWYTKTIDANIHGSIPNNDMEKIKKAYDRGITFWRNASEINNYTLSNNIL